VVHSFSIKAVPEVLLPALEREVSPHDRCLWEQLLEKYVHAEVHVMMAVDLFRVFPIDTAEFVELGRHQVFERSDKSRVKYTLGEAVSQQVPSELLLAF